MYNSNTEIRKNLPKLEYICSVYHFAIHNKYTPPNILLGILSSSAINQKYQRSIFFYISKHKNSNAQVLMNMLSYDIGDDSLDNIAKHENINEEVAIKLIRRCDKTTKTYLFENSKIKYNKNIIENIKTVMGEARYNDILNLIKKYKGHA